MDVGELVFIAGRRRQPSDDARKDFENERPMTLVFAARRKPLGTSVGNI